MHYDIVVIGAGPAGLSAAMAAAGRNKRVLVLGPKISEKLMRTKEINNYLGLPHLSGPDLVNRFRSHLEEFSVDFLEQIAQSVYDMGDFIGILMPDQSIIEAGAVVFAPGVRFGRDLPGEAEFLGRGVSSCATCDAALYQGASVIVVGYNDHSADEANFIAERAASTVFINETGRSVQLKPGIEEIRGRVREIRGDDRARVILVDDRELTADGFFIIRDAKKPDLIVPGIDLEGIHIQVDRKMATNLPGIFAAGDCTGGPYQVLRACGQGQVAGLSAAEFISREK